MLQCVAVCCDAHPDAHQVFLCAGVGCPFLATARRQRIRCLPLSRKTVARQYRALLQNIISFLGLFCKKRPTILSTSITQDCRTTVFLCCLPLSRTLLHPLSPSAVYLFHSLSCIHSLPLSSTSITHCYGVATISTLLKITGLFCKRDL